VVETRGEDRQRLPHRWPARQEALGMAGSTHCAELPARGEPMAGSQLWTGSVSAMTDCTRSRHAGWSGLVRAAASGSGMCVRTCVWRNGCPGGGPPSFPKAVGGVAFLDTPGTRDLRLCRLYSEETRLEAVPGAAGTGSRDE
jgi:hypothetical protein